jgi:hypothetical protein
MPAVLLHIARWTTICVTAVNAVMIMAVAAAEAALRRSSRRPLILMPRAHLRLKASQICCPTRTTRTFFQ